MAGATQPPPRALRGILAERPSNTEIADRRSEPSGDRSPRREEHAIETVDRLVDEDPIVDDPCRHFEVPEFAIELPLDGTSGLDRDPAFVREL